MKENPNSTFNRTVRLIEIREYLQLLNAFEIGGGPSEIRNLRVFSSLPQSLSASSDKTN